MIKELAMKELELRSNKNEIVIKKHKFLKAKENIKKFSNELPKVVELNKFETSGTILGFTDHNVTGDEMNNFVAELQKIIAFDKSIDIKIIDKFNEVYLALEALDSEYVPAILTAIKSTEESSFQAKEASNQALKAQSDIKKVIEQLKRHIEILRTFKDKIEKLEHIYEIDDIWDGLTDNSDNFKKLSAKYTSLFSKVRSDNEDFVKHFSDLDKARDSLNDVTDGLKKQQEETDGKISELDNRISDANDIIQKHDELINQIRSDNEDFTKHFSELDKARMSLNDITDGVKKQQEEIDGKISSLDNEYHILDSDYKKLYNKYMIAISVALISSIISIFSLVWVR